MFCGKCGSRIVDGSSSCQECGATVQIPQMQGGQDAVVLADINAKAKYRKIGMIAVAIATAVVLLIALLFCSGRGYKTTVNRFIDSVFDADVKTLIKLLPKEAVEEIIEDEYYGDKKDFIKDGEKSLKATMEFMKIMYGDKVKISHEITKVKDIKDDDLEDLQDAYDDEWDIKVSAAKRITVKVTIKGSNEESEEKMEIVVLKIGSSWYIDVESFDF